MLLAIIIFALIFDFLNGFHDSSNIVATVIASRAMHPRAALFLAALTHLIGPFLFGVAVATTVGAGLLQVNILDEEIVLAGLIAAVIWNLLTWYLGMPSSSSHALLGGLLGSSVLATQSFQVIQLSGLVKILLALFLSPPLGFLIGFLVMRLTLFAAQKATPKINTLFRRLQVLTLIGLGLAHGTNDAQKTMGVITLGLVIAGVLDTFVVPIWVIAISAGAIAIGTALGGWRLIRTLGGRIYRVRPIHGFTSQVSGASVILGAALLGGPVSTTQVMGSTIMGVGASERWSKVRWNIVRDILVAWLLTIPASALIAAAIYLLLTSI